MEQSVETYGRFRSLSPELSGKLDAKVLAQRKKSPNVSRVCFAVIVHLKFCGVV